MVKKSCLFKLGAILIWGLLVGAAYGQNTTISSSGVVDSDSITWANGTWSIIFRPSPNFPNLNTYQIGGAPLSPSVTSQSGSLSSGGSFSATVYDNTIVTPGGSSWTLNVCPQSSAPCSSYIFTALGSSMNLTSAINNVIKAPRFPAISGQFGYADVEAIMQNNPGSTYYNTTMLCQRVYTGAAWGCTNGGSGAVLAYPCFVFGTSNTTSRCGTGSDVAFMTTGLDFGSANVYRIVTPTASQFTTPNTGTTVYFLPSGTNTNVNPTLQVDSFMATVIQITGGLPVVPGDLHIGTLAILVYTSGAWVLQNPQISGHANSTTGLGVQSTGTATSSTNSASDFIYFLGSGWNSGVTLSVSNMGSGYTSGNTSTAVLSGGTCSIEPQLVAEGNLTGTLFVTVYNPGICTVAPTGITFPGLSSGSGWAGTLSVANAAVQTRFNIYSTWTPGSPSLASALYTISCPNSPPTVGPCGLQFMDSAKGPLADGYIWFNDAPTGSFAQDSIQLLSQTRTYKEPDVNGVRMVIVAIVSAANCGSLSGSSGCYEVNDGTGIHYIPKW